jgi:hypothetical protein
VPEKAEIHERVSTARLDHDECHEPCDPKPQRDERLRGTQFPLLGLAEAEGEAADPDGEGEKPGKVEGLSGAGLGPQGQGVQKGERDGDGG